MFEDIGKKIKGLALGVFWLETIGALIAGFAFMAMDEDLIGYGFLTMIVGPLAAWLSTLMLYAFGELVDKSSQNEENSCQILAILTKQKENTDSKETHKPQPATIPNSNSQAKPINAEGEDPVEAEIRDNQKVCPVCGMVQNADRRVCWKCSQKFEN